MARKITVSLLVLVGTALSATQAAAEDRFVKKLTHARQALEELYALPEGLPSWLTDDARCIAVIPSVAQGAFFIGGRHGRGVLACRNAQGDWSPFVFVKITGGSLGLQAGGEATDLVLFFMSERGVRSLLESRFILGADATVAAGPGRSAEASTDLKLRAEIYSYAKSRGLFAGLSLHGARLAPDYEWSREYYGERVWPEDVLFLQVVPRMSPEGEALLEALP